MHHSTANAFDPEGVKQGKGDNASYDQVIRAGVLTSPL
jgi:hypothetical protein